MSVAEPAASPLTLVRRVSGARARSRAETSNGSHDGSGQPTVPPASHVWLLSWLLVASLGAVVVTPPDSSLAIWWPATFVGVGILHSAPRSRWPVLLVLMTATTSLGQVLAERELTLSLGLGLITTLESLTIAWVLHRLDLTVLRTVADVGRLMIANLAGATTLALGLVPLMPLLPGADYLSLLGQVTLSHITAALCIGPLFLTRPSEHLRVPRDQIVQWALLFAVELWIFVGHGSEFSLVLLPVLLWGAVRLSPRAVAIQSTMLAAVAVICFGFERGPFRVGVGEVYSDWPEATFALQLFLSVLALTALVVSTATLEQKRAGQHARREALLSHTVLATTDALTLVVDADGTVELANAAATRATGYRREELVGRPVWETIVPPDRRDYARSRFSDLTSLSDFRLENEEELITRDGRVRRVRVSSSILDRGPDLPQSLVVAGIDVTAEHRARDLLTRMAEASSHTAAVGLELDGSICLFSQAAAELLGVEAEEALGKDFLALTARGTCDGLIDVVPGSAGAEEIARIYDLCHGESRSRARDWWWERADGDRIAVSQTLDEVTDVVGRRTGFLVVARDVTEERHSQEILLNALRREREAVEQLRLLDAAKNDFVTTVSHELRTPVTSIVGYAEIFRDEVDEASLQPIIDAIARNGYRLRDLADALVRLSDLERDEDPAFSTLDVRQELIDIIAHCGGMASAQRRLISLHDDVPADTTLIVQGNRDALRMAVGGLIDNALKYSDEGSEVTVALRGTEGHVRIHVADQGMGIPDTDLGHVFKRFHRGGNAVAQATQGPGLGLSLTDAVIRQHGGRVTLRSEEGVGTEVEVLLPLAAPETPGALDAIRND